jgi:hypothetical protein
MVWQAQQGHGGCGGHGGQSLWELISARSMRPGGATALLCASVDADSIKLVGRWKSDSMLSHLLAQPRVIGQGVAFLLEEAPAPKLLLHCVSQRERKGTC